MRGEEVAIEAVRGLHAPGTGANVGRACKMRLVLAMGDFDRDNALPVEIQDAHHRTNGRIAFFTGFADAPLHFLGVVDAEESAGLIVDADETGRPFPFRAGNSKKATRVWRSSWPLTDCGFRSTKLSSRGVSPGGR